MGMSSIDDRDRAVAGLRIPGTWAGDLIIGRTGERAAATLVARTIRLTILLRPAKIRGSLTWDQSMELTRHVALTLATDMPAYLAHRHSLGERPTNENTNGLVGEGLPDKLRKSPAPTPASTPSPANSIDRPRAALG